MRPDANQTECDNDGAAGSRQRGSHGPKWSEM